MNILLDSNALLFILNDDHRLSTRAKKAFLSEKNKPCLSLVSIWEIVLKASNGKLDMPSPFEKFLQTQILVNGIELIPLKAQHIYLLEQLPKIHKDPFDRLLVGQCLTEGLPIVTSDAVFKKYGVDVIW